MLLRRACGEGITQLHLRVRPKKRHAFAGPLLKRRVVRLDSLLHCSEN
jgi:hypothetical protein